MQFSFPQFSFRKNHLAPSLRIILDVSWWCILGLFFALLFLNGLYFYLYGLGYMEPASAPEGSSVLKVHEESIRNAAALIQKAHEKLEAPSPNLSSLTDPFR